MVREIAVAISQVAVKENAATATIAIN